MRLDLFAVVSNDTTQSVCLLTFQRHDSISLFAGLLTTQLRTFQRHNSISLFKGLPTTRFYQSVFADLPTTQVDQSVFGDLPTTHLDQSVFADLPTTQLDQCLRAFQRHNSISLLSTLLNPQTPAPLEPVASVETETGYLLFDGETRDVHRLSPLPPAVERTDVFANCWQ